MDGFCFASFSYKWHHVVMRSSRRVCAPLRNFCGFHSWSIPARSPDLNPIEMFWAWLRKELRKRDLEDLRLKRPVLSKCLYMRRVRAVLRTRKAQTFAARVLHLYLCWLDPQSWWHFAFLHCGLMLCRIKGSAGEMRTEYRTAVLKVPSNSGCPYLPYVNNSLCIYIRRRFS